MENSNTLKRADQTITDEKFPIPSKPESKELEWPNNVADLTSAQLAEHMTWWSGWAARVRYILARAETNELAFSEARRLKVQVGIHKSEGDKKSVTELRAAVEQGKDIQRLDAKILQAKSESKMLKALLLGYEEKYTTISREVSRRTREEWEERRNS